VAAVAAAAALALTSAAIVSWRTGIGSVASSTSQPRPDPTPAPEATDPGTRSPSPSALPSLTPTSHEPQSFPTDPARWPVVPHIVAAEKDRLRTVFLRGKAAANDAGVFAKIGDSITESKAFLADIGCGAVSLAGHTNLLHVIDVFSRVTFPSSYTTAWCGVANSFTRDSVSAVEGWTAADAMEAFSGTPPDPLCAEPPFDAPLPCELHLLHASVALIMYGTNDTEHASDPSTFSEQLDALVRVCIAAGVIPILSTIPPRPADSVMDERTQRYNEAIVKVAATEQIPLVNYWRALVEGDTVNEGVSGDGVHPNVYSGCTPHCQSTDFSPEGLRYGYNLRNLTALEALAQVLRIVIEDGVPDTGRGYSAG
jgi:hypothetical protein